MVLSVSSNSTLNFVSITPNSNSALSLPEEFSSQGLVFLNRVQVSKKRILGMNQFAYSDRKLLVFDRETGRVTKLKYPLDTGFSQKLLYCNNLNCKPEEIVSDRAILNARLVNDGKHILFLTPVSYDKEYKYYNIE